MHDEIRDADVWLSEDGTVQAIGYAVPGGPVAVTVTAVKGESQALAKASVPADALQGNARLRLNRDTGALEAGD